MIDQFAPIIPYVGAGGLRFGWSMEQVEKVTGPLGEGETVLRTWTRHAVGNQLWLYFYSDGTLDKIATLPEYGGRLFSLIDTNTAESELLWREPSLIYKNVGLYVTPKGVMIQPVNGRASHIIIFGERWKDLMQDIHLP